MYRFNRLACFNSQVNTCRALCNQFALLTSSATSTVNSSNKNKAASLSSSEVKQLKLDDAFKQVQQVWNINFAESPVTTDVLSFSRNKHAMPLFHILELDGSLCTANPQLKPEITKDTFRCNVNANYSDVESASSSNTTETGNSVHSSNDRCNKNNNTSTSPSSQIQLEEFVLTRATAEHMLTTMLTHNTMDKILLEAQRQGRISFYMTMFGEEASVVGVAAGLESYDEVFMQYRESGILTYRGFTIPQYIAQCMGNIEDCMKGRQMPIHYGAKELHVQMISSPLGTQIPHSAGAGYAIRLENEALRRAQRAHSSGNNDETNAHSKHHVEGNTEHVIESKYDENIKVHHHLFPRIVACLFGDGAASEGDFHAGLNAAILSRSHSLFIARNNGYAISTPTHNQYASDGIAGRAMAYGIPAIRVDGMDILAVCHATRQARKLILSHSLPAFMEAMTYRISHHSTSDDSSAYRGKDEMLHFAETFNPITRFEKFMTDCNWWTAEQSQEIIDKTRKLVFAELKRQEKLPRWPVSYMCDDVFEKRTWALEKQKNELEEHYLAHKEQYDNEKE